jgi:hypothetical protein
LHHTFDLAEMYKMIGLLSVNGLAPWPFFMLQYEHHNIFGHHKGPQQADVLWPAVIPQTAALKALPMFLGHA